MKQISSNLLRAATLALALPILGMSATIEINGSCYGSCPPPGTDPITVGQTIAGSSYNTTTVNGDSFTVSSTWGASFVGGTAVTFDPVVTYTGSGLSHADSVTVDFFQTYYDSSASNYDGTYYEHIPLSVSKNGTGTGDLLVDGLGVGAVEGNGPGYYDFYKSAYMTAKGSTLEYDYQFVFTFDHAAPGSTSSSTPEPAQMIPAAASLIGFALVALRRRKQ